MCDRFRPGASANPAVGKVGELEEIGEVRCEVICAGEDIARESVKKLVE